MSQIVKVGIRELRANLANYLKSSEPIAIVRHGRTVGYYLPAEEDDDLEKAAFRNAVLKLEKFKEDAQNA